MLLSVYQGHFVHSCRRAENLVVLKIRVRHGGLAKRIRYRAVVSFIIPNDYYVKFTNSVFIFAHSNYFTERDSACSIEIYRLD